MTFGSPPPGGYEHVAVGLLELLEPEFCDPSPPHSFIPRVYMIIFIDFISIS